MSCIHLLRGEKLSQSPLQDAQGPKHRAGCGCPGAVPALLAESCAPSHAGFAASEPLRIYCIGKTETLADFRGFAMRSTSKFFLRPARFLLLAAGSGR